MPAFRTHVSVNLCFGLPLSLWMLKYGVQFTPVDYFSFSLAYIYGTLFLHPDLDLTRNIKLFSLKGLLTLPFRPYSYLFSHRGISHIPIIGTLTRVIWLIGFFCLVSVFMNWQIPSFDESYLWLAIGGFVAADFFHIILDKVI